MRIGELAADTGVSRDTIRHYLSLGLIHAERDPNNGYQSFSHETAQRLRFVRVARALGFQLEEVRGILDKAAKGRSPCPDVRDIIQQRIKQTRAKITELEALCARMQSAIDQWDAMPDGKPTGKSICRLIESQDSSAGCV
jgi:MerR family Zn(II)-responsive transcriptional regulator of zntA